MIWLTFGKDCSGSHMGKGLEGKAGRPVRRQLTCARGEVTGAWARLTALAVERRDQILAIF